MQRWAGTPKLYLSVLLVSICSVFLDGLSERPSHARLHPLGLLYQVLFETRKSILFFSIRYSWREEVYNIPRQGRQVQRGVFSESQAPRKPRYTVHSKSLFTCLPFSSANLLDRDTDARGHSTSSRMLLESSRVSSNTLKCCVGPSPRDESCCKINTDYVQRRDHVRAQLFWGCCL